MAGGAVADLVADNDRLVRRWRGLPAPSGASRDPVADQLLREALLALSSDWAFMVTKDSAAQYARARHDLHHQRFAALADALDHPDRAARSPPPTPARRAVPACRCPRDLALCGGSGTPGARSRNPYRQ